MNQQFKIQNLAAALSILTLIFSINISNSKAAGNKPLTDTTRGPVLNKVERYPEFPGGLQAFGEFLGKNIYYPAVDKANKTEGRVIVTFVVETNGALSNIHVMRTPTQAMGDEAVRVLSLSPAWKPGFQDGKYVRVAYTVPISFKL
jgi:TonB family protein